MYTSFVGEHFRQEVFLSDTIREIKSKIAVKQGSPTDQLQLVYAGEKLADDRTVLSYNIQKKSTL